MDKDLTEHLLRSHGQKEVLEVYWYSQKDMASVVGNLMDQENYFGVLDVLRKYDCPGPELEMFAELFYEHAPKLLVALPVETIELWRANILLLDAARLLPAIIAVTRPAVSPSSAAALAADVMTSVFKDGKERRVPAIKASVEELELRCSLCIDFLRDVCRDLQAPSVYNTLLLLLAERVCASSLSCPFPSYTIGPSSLLCRAIAMTSTSSSATIWNREAIALWKQSMRCVPAWSTNAIWPWSSSIR